MIPQAYITEWSAHVPWQTNEQVEQDLVISRALVEIYNNPFLAERLAFRGGTALHKLFLQPQLRYSEDLDFVQITSEPVGPILDNLRNTLAFLGKAKVGSSDKMVTMTYKFESEILPTVPLKLKIETNCREHFAVLGWQKMSFDINSSWFKGACELTTYQAEELLGTKTRALYQRKKGRDLFDLFQALSGLKMDMDLLVQCYRKYMEAEDHLPAKDVYLTNLTEKMSDANFIGDIKGIIRPGIHYNQDAAFKAVCEQVIARM